MAHSTISSTASPTSKSPVRTPPNNRPSHCGVGNNNNNNPPEAERKENNKEEEEAEVTKSSGANLAGKKKRSMFGRRNTDAPRPEACALQMDSSLDSQVEAQKDEKKKGRQSAMKRRHTMADSKEMGHNPDQLDGHSGDNKKCILM
jgi:hypothetical protein